MLCILVKIWFLNIFHLCIVFCPAFFQQGYPLLLRDLSSQERIIYISIFSVVIFAQRPAYSIYNFNAGFILSRHPISALSCFSILRQPHLRNKLHLSRNPFRSNWNFAFQLKLCFSFLQNPKLPSPRLPFSIVYASPFRAFVVRADVKCVCVFVVDSSCDKSYITNVGLYKHIGYRNWQFF